MVHYVGRWSITLVNVDLPSTVFEIMRAESPSAFTRRQPTVPDGNQKKADVVEHLEVFDHVGLLVNEPPSYPGVLFI